MPGLVDPTLQNAFLEAHQLFLLPHNEPATITYRLTLTAPAPGPALGGGRLGDAYIPASSFQGRIRYGFEELKGRYKLLKEVGTSDDILNYYFGIGTSGSELDIIDTIGSRYFPDTPTRSETIFSQLVAVSSNAAESNEQEVLTFDRLHPSPIDFVTAQPRECNYLTVGTQFEGKIAFEARRSGIEIATLLSSLRGIDHIGAGRAKGLGYCASGISDRQDFTRCFVSYSHADEPLMQYCCALARRLRGNGVDAIIDTLIFSFSKDKLIDGELLNRFMRIGFRDTDYILAFLSPAYKYKAEHVESSGVAFEANLLRLEQQLLGEKLDRYICVLVEGDQEASVPSVLENRPLFDLRPGNQIDSEMSRLGAAIKSGSFVR